MKILSLHVSQSKAVRCYVNLIGERVALVKVPLDLLEEDFETRQFLPQEVIQRTALEREQMMQGAVVTLIDWDERSPVILSVLKDVARRNAVPLVVLCGPNKAEQVAALVVGGDAYLPYPLNPIMLQARLLAYQRLVGSMPVLPDVAGDGWPPVIFSDDSLPILEKHDVHRVGPMTLDRTARQFFASGRLVALTPKEFDLMAFFMQRVGVCQSRDEILDHVWGITYETGTNVLDVLLHGLRRKLATRGLKDMIQTVRGVGYRLVEPGTLESWPEHA